MELEIQGKGKTVVLIHGFLESSSMWDAFTKSSTHEYRFINVTLPVHGGEKEWSEHLSIQQVAKKQYESLKVFNPEWIIGHSLGGYLALELLLLFNNTRVVLLNSNYWVDSETKKLERERVVKVVKKNYSFFLNQAIPNLFMDSKKETCATDILDLINQASMFDKKSVVHVLRAMKNRRDFSKKIKKNKERVYFVVGENDPLLKKEDYELRIMSFFEDNYLITLQDTGHMSMMENPSLTIRYLKSILEN